VELNAKSIGVIIFVAVGLGGLIGVAYYLRNGMVDSECQDNMIQIMNRVNVYRHLHDQFPPNWMMIEFVGGNHKMSEFPCPGAVKNSSGPHSASSDYTYIPWTKSEAGQDWEGKLPVIYDANFSNHGGRGINIKMSDNSVMFDEGAKWLKAFAASHPTAKIPMPQ
jgi:hypothetical protein